MTCTPPVPIYHPATVEGINVVVPQGDGYSIKLDWNQAFPSANPYQVLYNIYFSTLLDDVFSEGVKEVWYTGDGYLATIPELTPGDTYYFAVRAALYDPGWYNPALLPDGFPDLKVYPEAVLLSDISDSDLAIPISDIDQFPSMGIIQIGGELIRYTSKDVPLNSLLLSSLDGRGYLNSIARMHTVDGYDGVDDQDPFVKFFIGLEDQNFKVHQGTCKFAYPNFARTDADGYRQITRDNFNTETSGSDADANGVIQPLPDSPDDQINFPPYDYSGYHRTDPLALLNGECVGTYYGGEQGCADGYNGVGEQVRGLPLNQVNAQRQEILLNMTGEPVVLVRKMVTGIVCSCVEPTTQNPSLRCPFCYGGGFITSYDQFYNPRRSDGRIMVRFGPTDDEVKIEDEGLESSFLTDCWTMMTPTLKSRDFIIRFHEDGESEEFRYKVLTVNRNKLISSLSGGQKFKAQRVRKTDPIYQWKAIRNTATMPQLLTTGIGLVPGPGGILPHTHTIVVNENIVSLSQINGTTSIAMGHNHEVRSGVVRSDNLSHSHSLILP